MIFNKLSEQRREVSDVLDTYLLKKDYINYTVQIKELLCCYNSIIKEQIQYLQEEKLK